MNDGCFLLLEDGSGSLLLEDGFHLLLEQCVPSSTAVSGGWWGEDWRPREGEAQLVVALTVALRRRRRLTVG